MADLDERPEAPPARRRTRHPLALALVGVVLLVAGSIAALEAQITAAPAPPPAMTTRPVSDAPFHPRFDTLPDIPVLTPPAFEMAGIGPDRNPVASGTGEPNAEIEIRDGAASLGQVRADAAGRWSFDGIDALAPGGHELTLAERAADAPAGRLETLGAEPMMLVVETAEAPSPPLATLADPTPAPGRPGEPTLDTPYLAPPPPVPAMLVPALPMARLASRPRAAVQTAAASAPGLSRPLHQAAIRHPAIRAPLLIETASYNVLGAPYLSGRAADGAPLRVIVDGRTVGRASANGSGRWSVALDGRVKAGRHHVRVEEIAASGQILAVVEKPLIRD